MPPTDEPTPTESIATDEPSATASPSDGAIGALGPVTGGDGGGSGSGADSGGPLPGTSEPGLGGIVSPLVLLGMVAGGIWAVFLVLGRRRRDDEEGPAPTDGRPAPPTPAPALAMAGPAPAAPAPSWPSAGGPVVAAAATAAALDIPFGEAEMPRWRRPSVQAARKASSRGPEMPHVPVAFREEASAGVVRARVGYRLVRVTSIPDELLGDEVGRLDRGDQVEILESSGVYRRVRAADGTEGWIHKMTLSNDLDDPDEGDYPEDL